MQTVLVITLILIAVVAVIGLVYFISKGSDCPECPKGPDCPECPKGPECPKCVDPENTKDCINLCRLDDTVDIGNPKLPKITRVVNLRPGEQRQLDLNDWIECLENTNKMEDEFRPRVSLTKGEMTVSETGALFTCQP